MKSIEEVTQLLNKNTSDMGSWTISFNDHKGVYEKPEKFYGSMEEIADGKISEVLESVDTNKDIYYLHWYKDTPIGFYDHCFNSLEEMYKWISEIIKED